MSEHLNDSAEQIFTSRPMRMAAIMLVRWIELPVIAGFIVWVITDRPGSKPCLSSTSALLGIATAVVLFVALALLAIPAGRSRVIATPSKLVVVNLFRTHDIVRSQLRRVYWTRYRPGLGRNLPWFPVVTFAIQTEPEGRLSRVRAMSSVAGPREGDLIEYLEQLCSAYNIPCDLTKGSW
jgi:hypothetical protein